ncbi:MAG: hypothetical protein AAGA57_10255 [Planctomycetota bacterium]
MKRTAPPWFRPALAGLAALLAVACVNGLAFQLERRAPPGLRSALRIDLTASSRLSLSPQTLAALDGLTGDIEIVLLADADADGAMAQTLDDLAREYAQRSPRVAVRRIAVNSEEDASTQVAADIAARFTDAIQRTQAQALPVAEGLRNAADHLSAAAQALQRSADAAPGQDDGLGAGNDLRLAAGRIDQASQSLTVLAQQGSAFEDEPLPELTGWLDGVRERVAAVAAEAIIGETRQLQRLEPRLRDHPAAFDAVLSADRALKQANESLSRVSVTANGVEPDPALAALRASLEDEPWAVVLGPTHAAVLPRGAMFRASAVELPDHESAKQANTTESFVGEEALTGALLRVIQPEPMLAVFLLSDTGPAMGGPDGAGLFRYAGERLARLGADVRQWRTPVGSPGDVLRDLPLPRDSQPAVYVALPFSAPRGAAVSDARIAQETAIAQALEQRLSAGDGAVVLLNFDPTQSRTDEDADDASTAPKRPITALLREHGVEADLAQRAARLAIQAGGGRLPTGVFQPTLAPEADAHPIARAIVGLPMRFELPSPLTLTGAASPVVTLRQRRQWTYAVPPGVSRQAQTDRIETASPSAFRDAIAIAAAIEASPTSPEGDAGRLFVVAEPTWAADPVAAAGVSDQQTSASARRAGARLRYPGNGELWVNGVLWAAGLDRLVAASPRSRDVPRIDALTPERRRAVRATLLFGVPGGVLVIGLAAMRRRRA